MPAFTASGLIAAKLLSNAKALSSGVTDYSNSIQVKVWAGFTSCLVALSGVSPNVTISQQCSEDNTNWYDPVDNAGNALGVVYSGLNSTKFIEFAPVIAPYIRFKYVPAADTTITLTLNIKE